jgi:hypothetical protein
LKEHITSIFRVDEKPKQETSLKTGGKQRLLAYSLTLKMEVICSSEMLVDFSADYMALNPRRQKSSTIITIYNYEHANEQKYYFYDFAKLFHLLKLVFKALVYLS